MNDCLTERLQRESDEKCVLAAMQAERLDGAHTDASIQSRTQQYVTERRQRIVNFIKHVDDKRTRYMRDLYTQNALACS